ncbi:Glutathione S-transferase [Chamberlinius hualienensis]
MAPPVIYGVTHSPPVRAVLLTAKAAGIDIEFKLVNLATNDHFDDDYIKINPAHTIPTLDDNGFVIWESRVIMTYLIEKYGQSVQSLYPKDLQERTAVDNMLHFDNGTLWASVRRAFFGPLLFGEPAPVGATEVFRDRVNTLERILTTKPYAAGDHLTLADISLISSLSIPATCDFSYDKFPHVNKWMSKVISELPFYDEVTKEGLTVLREKYEANWKKLQQKLF